MSFKVNVCVCVLRGFKDVAGYILIAVCVCVCVWTRVFAASQVIIVRSPDANHANIRVHCTALNRVLPRSMVSLYNTVGWGAGCTGFPPPPPELKKLS